MRNVVLRGSLLALLVLALGSGPASAHAALVGTDPQDGSTHDAAPTTITLTFNENIGNPSYVAVQAPDGMTVDVAEVEAVDHTVTATVADADKRGRYSASYRVVSADGHPVEGTFSYTVTSGRVVDQVVTSASDEDFFHRHSDHLFWGILAAVVAIVLLLAPLRRRRDPSDT